MKRRKRRSARRRGRNPGYAYNRSRRSRRRSYRSFLNPSGAVKSLTAGFSMPVLTRGVGLAGGAVATGVVGNLITNQVLGRVAPSLAGNQYVGWGVDLVAAGVSAMVAGKVLPKYRDEVLQGGVLKVLVDVMNAFLPGQYKPFSGMGGVGDFLTESQVAAARSLGGFGDFLTESQVADARSLGGMDDISGGLMGAPAF